MSRHTFTHLGAFTRTFTHKSNHMQISKCEV